MNVNNNIKNLPVLDRMPSKSDGRDGATYIIRDKGSVYIYHKHGSDWYRTKLEKI